MASLAASFTSMAPPDTTFEFISSGTNLKNCILDGQFYRPRAAWNTTILLAQFNATQVQGPMMNTHRFIKETRVVKSSE